MIAIVNFLNRGMPEANNIAFYIANEQPTRKVTAKAKVTITRSGTQTKEKII